MKSRFRIIAFSSVVVALGCNACGSRQRTEEVQAVEVEDFDCVSDRWADPPREIGQTPPDSFPSALDVDPFNEDARPVRTSPSQIAPSTEP